MLHSRSSQSSQMLQQLDLVSCPEAAVAGTPLVQGPLQRTSRGCCCCCLQCETLHAEHAAYAKPPAAHLPGVLLLLLVVT